MHISVTAMATDSVVTAQSVANKFTVMYISLLHKCELAVTAVSMVTAVTPLSSSSLLHRRHFTSPTH